MVNKAIDKAVTDLSEIITTFAQQVDNRFNKVEKELSELRESHHRLLNTIDGFIGRIDRYEIEQAAEIANSTVCLSGRVRFQRRPGYHSKIYSHSYFSF